MWDAICVGVESMSENTHTLSNSSSSSDGRWQGPIFCCWTLWRMLQTSLYRVISITFRQMPKRRKEINTKRKQTHSLLKSAMRSNDVVAQTADQRWLNCLRQDRQLRSGVSLVASNILVSLFSWGEELAKLWACWGNSIYLLYVNVIWKQKWNFRRLLMNRKLYNG